MLLDGNSAVSVAERLGLPGANLPYRWKRDPLIRPCHVRTLALFDVSGKQ